MAAKPRDGLSIDAALRAALRALPDVAAGLKRAGVPTPLQPLFSAGSLGPRHIPALSYLLMDGPMSVGELASRLGLAMPTTSLLVAQLAQYELVDRRPDPGDRRRTVVRIADAHRDTVRSWLDLRATPIRRTLRRLSPTEREVFCRALTDLAEELRRR